MRFTGRHVAIYAASIALAAIATIFAVNLAIETFIPRKELPPPKTTLETFKPERK